MALYSVAKDRDLAITEAPTSRRGAGCQRQLAWLRFSLFRLKPIFFQVCAHCEQLDSQYCATLVAFQRPHATVRYVSGSNCPLYIDFLFPSIGSIFFFSKCPTFFLASCCHWLPAVTTRLAEKKNRDQGFYQLDGETGS